MYLLAFETSCDDTSVAVFHDDQILSMVTKRQIAEHQETHGVVPEVAARAHANVVFEVLQDALAQSGVSLSQIEVIACTDHPGLLPSLLVGMTVAKTLAHLLHIRVLFVDHITAHMFSNFLERSEGDIPFPCVCLTVSGGHNELYRWDSLHARELLGQTYDDSAGEAFDKVAKMLGLGFPGGPHVSHMAELHKGSSVRLFPRVMLEKGSLNFSFSGLKSAVKREIDARKNTYGLAPTQDLPDEDIAQICFEFQEAVVDVLSAKLFLASEQQNISNLVLAGGVSANALLKERISLRAKMENKHFLHPIKPLYSQDNAAMV